ncbi:TPA: hypothetical protein ACX6RO_001797 [Photobacterium damselae]
MATMRFSEAFLVAQIEKRKQWSAKGHKAGHGGNYNLDLTHELKQENTIQALSRNNRPAKAPIARQSSENGNAKYLTALRSGISVDSLDSWLIDIIKDDDDIALALVQKGYMPQSAHKQALVELAKDFTLLTGKPKTETSKGRNANIEHYIQVRLFYLIEKYYPEEYYFVKAVPNGGIRGKKTRFDMQAEGQKKGAHDIDIDLPKGRYHGCKVEVKRENGTLSIEQKVRLERLEEKGYFCYCGKGFDQCWSVFKAYFELPDFDGTTEIDVTKL